MGCDTEINKAVNHAANNGDEIAKRLIEQAKRNDRNGDAFPNDYINPNKHAVGIIERQNWLLSQLIGTIGKTAVSLLKPTANSLHEKATKYSIYNTTLSAIRTGFIDSEIAKQMRDTLNVRSNVNQKLLNKILSMGDAIAQKMADYLTDNMPKLDKKIAKVYKDKKDQKTLFQLFSKTGLAGLSNNKDILRGVLYEDMSIDEAIEKLNYKDTSGKIDKVAEYYITGNISEGMINLERAEIYDKKAHVLVALLAIKKIENGEKFLKAMDKELTRELFGLSLSTEALNREINHQKEGIDGVKQRDAEYNNDYDGHYTMDLYDSMYEYKVVTKADLKSSIYADKDWQVIQQPADDVIGIIAREKIAAGTTPGVGLNTNRFKNGFILDEKDKLKVDKALNSLKGYDKKQKYLDDNNLIKEQNGEYRLIIPESVKEKHLKPMYNVAHSLWRTYVHNLELVQMESIREIVIEHAIETIYDEDDLSNIEEMIKNDEDIPMFLDMEMSYEAYEKLPTLIKKEYKTPQGLSNYNGFNKKISLVKKGSAHILLGHKNTQIFDSDTNRGLAKAERIFKQIVIMAKQNMVVLSPVKLGIDTISNVGILLSKDVDILSLPKEFSKGFDDYNEYSKLRGDLVQEEFLKRLGKPNKVEQIEKELKEHPFNDAFEYGFIQSYSTALIVKDFDTVSGLQKTINDIIEGITTDKETDKYNEIHKAIKWWQKLGADKGLTVDSLMLAASNLSMMKGTKVGDELILLSERLKSKKDIDSVAEYVNDIIGGPNSEVMKLGSGVMVGIDVVSKYTLAKSLLQRVHPDTLGTDNPRLYTIEEAYSEANETFIDYRRNMPPPIKALSDYGILLFPSFWMKAQKIVVGLAYYHPWTAIGGYATADVIGMNNANFMDVNIINKILDGRVINNPTDLLGLEVLSWVIPM